MDHTNTIPDFGWGDAISHTEAYLLHPLKRLLPSPTHRDNHARVLDIGCGNGWLCGWLAGQGFTVVGVDPAPSGICEARKKHAHIRFEILPATPALLHQLNEPPFDIVVSLEVVEHCYTPREWAQAAFSCLKPGGWLICSTPYHGYWKNLALALSGKMDSHFTALWDGGHIKFWSRRTLMCLLREAGFQELSFVGAGRIPWLWKSMLLKARRPV